MLDWECVSPLLWGIVVLFFSWYSFLFSLSKNLFCRKRKQFLQDILLKQTQCSVHIVNQELLYRPNQFMLCSLLKHSSKLCLLQLLYTHGNIVEYRLNFNWLDDAITDYDLKIFLFETVQVNSSILELFFLL